MKCGNADLRQSNILGSLQQGYCDEGGKLKFVVTRIGTANIYSKLFMFTYHCLVSQQFFEQASFPIALLMDQISKRLQL